MSLLRYIPIADALASLFDPLVEVVIHELATDTICHISGQLSNRKVGDPSLLDKDAILMELSKTVYPKINFDGRLIKSISVLLEERYLLCINCDISVFNDFIKIGTKFLSLDSRDQPKSLFINDWQERLHLSVHAFLTEKNWHFADLNLRQKKELIKHLYDAGAFSEKRAADYLAQSLSLGRATIFNYLKEWRKTC